MEAELARTRAAVDSLRGILAPGAEAGITHRSVPATPAIAIRETVDQDVLLP